MRKLTPQLLLAYGSMSGLPRMLLERPLTVFLQWDLVSSRMLYLTCLCITAVAFTGHFIVPCTLTLLVAVVEITSSQLSALHRPFHTFMGLWDANMSADI